MEKFRYWYEPTKQYGYELVSLRVDSLTNEETGENIYKTYADVFLEKPKHKTLKKSFSSVEGYLDDNFRQERSTGLISCDGDEIYENDIISVVYDTLVGDGKYEEREIIGVLRYGDPCNFHSFKEWYLENDEDIYSMNCFECLIVGDDIRVLGNINEDKKLYKKVLREE